MTYDEEADFAEKRAYVSDLLSYLEPVSGPEKSWRALEIGGGGGVLAGLLGHHLGHVIATDLVSPDKQFDGQLAERLIEKFGRHGETYPSDVIEFLAADAQRLPFRDNWFDLTFSQNAFEHIPDPEMALRECIRVTRPGGFVYIQFDPVWTADSGSHFIHRLAEPWLHLLAEDHEVEVIMASHGATTDEIAAFRTDMNRHSIRYYREMFPRVIRQLQTEIVLHHEWSGTMDPSWNDHPNLEKAAIRHGLTKEELTVRGMRYLLRVQHQQ